MKDITDYYICSFCKLKLKIFLNVWLKAAVVYLAHHSYEMAVLAGINRAVVQLVSAPGTHAFAVSCQPASCPCIEAWLHEAMGVIMPHISAVQQASPRVFTCRWLQHFESSKRVRSNVQVSVHMKLLQFPLQNKSFGQSRFQGWGNRLQQWWEGRKNVVIIVFQSTIAT